MNDKKDSKTTISQIITKRIKNNKKARFFANDNISKYIQEGELSLLQKEVEDKVRSLLQSLIIDVENDHNTNETARRVAKMYIKEIFSGRYTSIPEITKFPNDKLLDELYVLGPITVRSTCSHHLAPIIGKAWVGVLPAKKILGLSKFNRLVHWVMSRPQIQEEAAIVVADIIEKGIKPRGLGVVIQAKHFCMHWRGVKEPNSFMSNSIVRGIMRSNHKLKEEFFDILKSQGFGL